MNKELIKSEFNKYVSDYDTNDTKIYLKIVHTFRVADMCEVIAESLCNKKEPSYANLSNDDITLAWTIGMLHDIARFEQVRIYGTFNDSQSVDHAELGADLLFKEGLVECFEIEPEYHGIIETAIRNHNKYRLPENLSDRELMFCKIIRDADKVDIIRVNYDQPIHEIYNVSEETLKQEAISDTVYNAFFEHSAINHSLKETTIDRVVGHASLCYELEYKKSRQLALEQGYIQKLLDYKSDNAETRKRLVVIKEYILDYLSKRVNECV